MHNLAGNPKHAATRVMLDAQLRELMRELKDPLPLEKVFGGPLPSTATPPREGP
jgi:hypothetical protein